MSRFDKAAAALEQYGLDALLVTSEPNRQYVTGFRSDAGTVLSAEPGIYLPGRFGVRIEDVIVLTDDGCLNITNAAKELLIL